MTGPTERLIVVEPAAGDVLVGLGASVRHVASSRLAVVVVDDTTADELRRRPGVRIVTDTAPPSEVMAMLLPDEQLFVAGWLLRGGDKDRIGDGLPWDTTGFDPPDPPTSQGTG